MILTLIRDEPILFIADGARWIWNRVPGLINDLCLNPENVYELFDFYQAVEHLGTVAGLRKSWSAKERKAWITKQRRLLMKGESIAVVRAVQTLCRGRNSKDIKRELNYFVRNEKRLAFTTVKALNLHCSGIGRHHSSLCRHKQNHPFGSVQNPDGCGREGPRPLCQ